MKAIFAVSALAAAISAQAIAADTEISTKVKGSMDTSFTLDLLPDDATYDVDLVDDGDSDAGYNISIDWAITNGPLSATIGVESTDDDDADGQTNSVTVDDITVTEGKLTFGQVGSLMDTDEYTGDMEENGTAGVDAGFTYAVAEGVKVQVQGLNNSEAAATETGLAAQYTGSADALAYTVEGEATFSAAADNTAYFVGAGVTYTADMFTVKAAVNAIGDAAGATDMEYAVSATVNAAGATVKLAYTEDSTETEDDELLEASVAYTVDAITATAAYDYTTADGGDELMGKLAYKEGAIAASAAVTIADFDADTAGEPEFELDVSYTSEMDVVYYAGYDFQTDASNALTLGAKYSF